MDQLVRRVDPYHRDLYKFFHEEIAVPFGKYHSIAVIHRTTVNAHVYVYIEFVEWLNRPCHPCFLGLFVLQLGYL